MNVMTHESDIRPMVYMDLYLNSKSLGRITIQLHYDSFPDGVENFMKIIGGDTYHSDEYGPKIAKYIKKTRRSYESCIFYRHRHNNYIVSGDIYRNDGSSAGTIYDDEPIEANFGEYFYPHETKGLVTLVPFIDENGDKYYDSTFMITLDNIKPDNVIGELDKDHVVIGNIVNGIHILDEINDALAPVAKNRSPVIRIGKCGYVNGRRSINSSAK